MSDDELVLNVNVGRLLQAIRDVETGLCPTGIRFEAAYMPRGYRFALQGRLLTGTGHGMTALAQDRWVRWGVLSAASYGPWQILYHTAANLGFDGHPCELLSYNASLPWVEALLHRIARRGARSLREIGDAWNSGTHRDHLIPEDYIAKLEAAYNRAV